MTPGACHSLKAEEVNEIFDHHEIDVMHLLTTSISTANVPNVY